MSKQDELFQAIERALKSYKTTYVRTQRKPTVGEEAEVMYLMRLAQIALSDLKGIYSDLPSS